jgi:glycosyltransferase involved in cell wall biosynthesis
MAISAPVPPPPGAPALRKPGGLVSRVAYRGLMTFHKPLMFIDWYARVHRLLRDEAFDVIHAHDLNTLPVAVALGRRRSIPVVYDAHELYPDISTLSRREQRVWRFIEKRLIRRTAAVVTVCESISRELADRHSIAPPAVILNSPPRGRAGAPNGDASLRSALGCADDEPLILYQGGFSANRGLEGLIESLRYVETGLLVLMGWGQLEATLRELVLELDLSPRVRFVAPVPQAEVVKAAAGADIGVIPYRPIGLNNLYSTPNKLFDYMASGLAIAGSRLPEIERFVRGEQLGVTFDPADPHDIGAALNFLVCHDTERIAMGERSLAASTQYAWETQADVLRRVYAELPNR